MLSSKQTLDHLCRISGVGLSCYLGFEEIGYDGCISGNAAVGIALGLFSLVLLLQSLLFGTGESMLWSRRNLRR